MSTEVVAATQPKKIVAENLKKARKAAGLTQDKASALLKIRRSVLGSYEEGRAMPPIVLFPMIADLYGIVDWKRFIRDENFNPNRQGTVPPPPSIIDIAYKALPKKLKEMADTLLNLR
jgi:transcriptional regulator with XRE-family HTH domain